jgi:hypothetical protein
VGARWDLVSSGNDFALAGANPVPPDLMSPDERLAELARIVAAGLLRLRRQSHSSSRHLRDFRLDLSPDRSVHATTGMRRKVAR